MKKLLLLLNVLVFMSCSSQKEEEILIVEKKSTNKIELQINGQKIDENIIDINSYYICDEKIYVDVSSKIGNVTSKLFTLELLRNGELSFAKFVDKKTAPTYTFSTADFIPSSTFSIDDFEFVENKKLKIKFSGTLFKQLYNLNNVSETLQISGTIEINEFGKSICNIFNDFINLNEQIKFTDISRSYQETKPNLTVWYESNSLGGFKIEFRNFTKFLQNMEIGTYNFNSLSSTERIEFKKYTGIPKYFGGYFLPNDWKIYSTNGSFTIVEKRIVDGQQVVKIKLNFTASYNGIVEYDFKNAEFETAF